MLNTIPKMKSRIFYLIMPFYCCLLLYSCTGNYYTSEIREGDILFQNLDCGGLCDAIEAVTEGVNGKDFSHCALVVRVNDSLKVIEAIGDKVQLTSLQAFFTRSGDTTIVKNITLGRLKDEYSQYIPKAVNFAIQQLGVPYDEEFLMNNNKWYCSELIYQSFKLANNQHDFFELQPMTFKEPATHNYFTVWIDYYNNLNKPIPEGEPGINPGLISRSDKIQIINLK